MKTVAAFEEMRQNILSMYESVTVRHSFLLGSVLSLPPVTVQMSPRLIHYPNPITRR